MKRQTVILPFSVPRLTDKAAAQLLELLHALIQGIEHHYADQIHRYHRREHDRCRAHRSPASNLPDPSY